MLIDPTEPNVIYLTGHPGVDFSAGAAKLNEQAALNNDDAFAEAWTAALAHITEKSRKNRDAGVILRVAPGFYLINYWDISVNADLLGIGQSDERTLNVRIEADGVVLISTRAIGETFQANDGKMRTTPEAVVHIGSSDGGNSMQLAKAITISGLKIQADINALQAWVYANRIGLLVEHAQEVHLERIWVSGMTRGGMSFLEMMDSTITDCQVMWCGFDGEFIRKDDDPRKSLQQPDRKYYGVRFSSVNGNPNAIRVIGLHVEFCDLVLLMDGGSRHIDFFGCKFEHGIWTMSATSPHVLGGPTNANALGANGAVREISFHGCMFVQNTYLLTETMLKKQKHPSHITVFEENTTSIMAVAKGAVSYIGCHFETPDGCFERWFTGSNTSFIGCDFAACGNMPDDDPVFDLADHVQMIGCRYTLRSVSKGGLNDDKTYNGRADFVRFRGEGSRILDPIIFYGGTPGTFLKVGPNAMANEIAGWRTALFGFPSGSDIIKVAYEVKDAEQLGRSVYVAPFSPGFFQARLETPAPSVFGLELGRIEGHYTDFVNACAGQVIRLRASGVSTIAGGTAIRLKGGATTRTVNPGELVSFYYDATAPEPSTPACWFEI